MRESKMATVRLPISFTLSVCTGVALFGLLHALIAVDRDGGIIDVVPDVVFRPDVPIISCPVRPFERPRTKPCSGDPFWHREYHRSRSRGASIFSVTTRSRCDSISTGSTRSARWSPDPSRRERSG
jgi:hypothetical protein